MEKYESLWRYDSVQKMIEIANGYLNPNALISYLIISILTSCSPVAHTKTVIVMQSFYLSNEKGRL